jgi:hypothetical protein
MGETQVYGLGISDDELLTAVLEKELNNRIGRQQRCRVINLGVRGFTLNQQYALLESIGVGLQADHVIIMMYIYSLGRTNLSRYYERVKHRDWYMADIGDKPSGRALLKWHMVQLARKSAFVAWLHSVYKGWQTRSTLRGKLLRGVKDEKVTERFAYVRDQLRQFRELGHLHDFGLSLGAIPVPAQLTHDFPHELYLSELRKMASSLKIPFFDFLSPLRRLYKESGLLPVAPFDEHYDATAHRIMAVHLADRFNGCGA